MRILCSALLLTAGLVAQPAQPNIVWHKDNQASVGGRNAFPWGSDGIRYQTIVTNTQMGGLPAVVTDVFVAGDLTLGDNEVVYGDIEIRMGVTPQPTPVANWTTNNPNPVTVYRGPLRVNFRTGQWSGIGLPNTYVWLPTSANDHLCFEVIVWSVKDRGPKAQPGQNFFYPLAPNDVPRTFLFNWVGGGGHSNPGTPLTGSGGSKIGLLLFDGNLVELGKGCNSSAATPLKIFGDAGKWPQQGQVFNFNLSGGKPGSPAFLMLGSREDQWGSIQLPFDLGQLNAPGCTVWHDWLVGIPAAVDQNGNAKFTLPLPGGTQGVRLKAGWANLDPTANGLGLTTSNFASLLVGK